LGDPAAPVAGSVLGKTIRASDVDLLRYYILKTLADRYAREEGITATAQEKRRHAEQVRESVAAATGQAPERSPEADAAREQVAEAFIVQWKLNAAVYRRYGGRIAWQQGGPEPLDAWRRFLEESRARGDFTILDPGQEEEFWRYWRTDSLHSFFVRGSPEEAKAFAAPPWLSAPPP
jgi:hypothetical protein